MWQRIIAPNKLFLLTVFCILILAFTLRTIGLNWDQGQHLHPDERFLTMVTNAMKLPNSLDEYLDPAVSKMNPTNIGYEFFVYGTLPLVIAKIIALQSGLDDYGNLALLGRLLSAFYDTIATGVVMLIVYRVFERAKSRKNLSLLAGFFYAVSVLPIQLSHFYTTDILGSLLSLMAFLFSVYFYQNQKYRFVVLGGISAGLAIACKVSAIFGLIPSALLYIVAYWKILRTSTAKSGLKQILLLTVALFFSFLSLRLGNPYYFQNKAISSFEINKKFSNSLQQLKNSGGFDVWVPPATQWMTKSHEIEYACKTKGECALSIRYFQWEKDKVFPITGFFASFCDQICRYRIYPSFFGLYNLLIFGVGPVLALLFVLGIFRMRKIDSDSVLVWALLLSVLIPLGYFSFQFVASMRYLISVYPFVAIFASIGGLFILQKIENLSNNKTKILLGILMLLVAGLYAYAFVSIYKRPHSRVQASRYIYANLPNRAIIATEHWDDGLPVGQPPEISQGKTYDGRQLEVFYADSPAKWEKINKTLSEADYYILTSNRGWGTMMNFGKRYPLQAKFYRDLFDGRTDYEFVAKFSSYPRICLWGELCYDYIDNGAEEAFSVYDHPEVYIFKNTKK